MTLEQQDKGGNLPLHIALQNKYSFDDVKI
jgi:hypothetical protein